MSEEIKEIVEAPTVEAPTEVEMQFSHSPVSNIINDVWRAPSEPPVAFKGNGKKRKTIKPKGAAVLELPPMEEEEVLQEVVPPQPVTIQLTGEQLLAVFDGLKLLLAKLSNSDPQPLHAIYITTGLIQGLEGVTVAQLRALMEARA